MTLVLCGVAADTGNVRPVPAVDADGRFEYVPIPEKCETTESTTYGTRQRRHGDGSLATLLDAVRPRSEGEWLTGEALRSQPIHHDPNLDALTYGEHRPGYVTRLRDLGPGDAVGFYAGFRGPDGDRKHRYLFGHLVVDAPPTVLAPDLARATVADRLADHPHNAHARRFEGRGRLYYHDPAVVDNPRDVVVVSGRSGGLADRAVRLSGPCEGSHYYTDPDVARRLDLPVDEGGRGPYLGGFKPAVESPAGPDALRQLLRSGRT